MCGSVSVVDFVTMIIIMKAIIIWLGCIIIIEQLIVIIRFFPPSLHSIIIQTLENEHHKPVPTSSNLAYGVVSHDQAREGGGGGGGGGGGEEGGGEETQAYELVAMTQPRPRPPRSTTGAGPSSSQHQAGGLHAIPQAGPGTGMEEPAYAVITDK